MLEVLKLDKFKEVKLLHPLNILSKYFTLSVLKFEISKNFKDSQFANILPKLKISDVSKVDKFNDINDLQPQNISAVCFKLFEVINPDKSNDFNELQSLNILDVLVHFVASKPVKFISIIESQPRNMLQHGNISFVVHINFTILEGFKSIIIGPLKFCGISRSSL